jgi:hypothetical protein
MVLFMILMIMLAVLVVFTVAVVGVAGGIGIILTSDIIVCIGLIGLVIWFIFFRK